MYFKNDSEANFMILDDFILFLRAEKGLSPNSIEAYRHDISSFLKKHTVDIDNILQHLSCLKQKGYASSSISRALIAIKVFIRFLFREKKLEKDLSVMLDTPKLWQLIPEILTESEVTKLLQAPRVDTFHGARDKAILEVLYASGLRVSELCALSLYSIDDSSVRVFGKGGKERVVPIGRCALDAVDYYLLNFRDGYEGDALFITKKGHRINRIEVWKRIKKYAKDIGLNKSISPHTMRHSFATHLLDNGADLRIIQEMLGHSHISTTDRYTHVGQSKVKNSFFKYHPRNSCS